MKKITIVFCLYSAIMCYADGNVDSLRIRIADLDTAYYTAPKRQQQDILLDTKVTYHELDSLLTKIIEQHDKELMLYAPYKDYIFLLSEDTMVFKQRYSDMLIVPSPLRYHYETIKMVAEARELIEKIENKIYVISEQYKKTDILLWDAKKAKENIVSEIETDVLTLDDLLDKIEGRDLSTLSKSQYEYFRPGLIARYNNFIKFFE